MNKRFIIENNYSPGVWLEIKMLKGFKFNNCSLNLHSSRFRLIPGLICYIVIVIKYPENQFRLTMRKYTEVEVKLRKI